MFMTTDFQFSVFLANRVASDIREQAGAKHHQKCNTNTYAHTVTFSDIAVPTDTDFHSVFPLGGM